MAWAFASARHADMPLSVVIARATEHRVYEFKPQNLANTAWAFAMVEHSDEFLFAALAKKSERCMHNFNL